jgi:hypothetical protein
VHHRKRAQSIAGVLVFVKKGLRLTRLPKPWQQERYYGITRLRLDMTVNLIQRPDPGPGRLVCGGVPSDGERRCQDARASARISSEHLVRTNTSTLSADTTTPIVKALAPVTQDPPPAHSISVVNIQAHKLHEARAHSAIAAARAGAVTLPAWTAVTADRQPAQRHKLSPPVPYSR